MKPSIYSKMYLVDMVRILTCFHCRVKHIKLEFDRSTIKVGKESFNSLPEMINFYQNSVPVSLAKEPVFLSREVDSQGLSTCVFLIVSHDVMLAFLARLFNISALSCLVGLVK